MVSPRKSRRNRINGGASPPFPLKYYDPSHREPSAPAGGDILRASGMQVRPDIPTFRASTGGMAIGAKRSTRAKKLKGGFIPSIMDGFVTHAAKYIVPLALFAGYKLLTRKGKKGKRSTRKR